MVEALGDANSSGLLFDTSVVIAAFGEDEAVVSRLRQLPAERILIPVIVVGEFAFGALTSARAADNLGRLAEFEAAARTVPCDAVTARFYGEIKAGLKRIGRPNPENDAWIAALALRHSLTLATRDAHFRHVVDLRLEHW